MTASVEIGRYRLRGVLTTCVQEKVQILPQCAFRGRFGELRKAIPDITQTMLTKQLRDLERDGLVKRRVYAEVPPKVEYSATEDGIGLMPAFKEMHSWWEKRQA